MKQGQKSNTKDGTQNSLFPLSYMNISQGSNGGFSHSGTKAIDYLGWNGSGRVYQCPYYAPFDCTCTYKSSDGAGIGWTSDKDVQTPSGKRKVTIVYYHDNKLGGISIGDKRKQGEIIGYTGTAGNVTGDHAHIEVFTGSAYASPTIENWETFFVNDTVIVEDLGYNWKQTSDSINVTLKWIAKIDTYLTESEQMNNAQLVAYHFFGTDWTKESICALIGNMSHESTMNPELYEMGYGHSPSRGYGLVQWTPATKLWDWCNANGLDWSNGDSQLARIDYEVEQNIQWIANRHAKGYGRETKYDFSFTEFRTNAGGYSVEQLTEAFMWNYEAPAYQYGLDSLLKRQSFAVKCFNELDFSGAGSGGGGGTDKPKTTDALIYMFLSNTLRGWG